MNEGNVLFAAAVVPGILLLGFCAYLLLDFITEWIGRRAFYAVFPHLPTLTTEIYAKAQIAEFKRRWTEDRK
jgi:hypothetical protein